MNWACVICPETGTTDASEKRHREATSHATSAALRMDPPVTPLCGCGHRAVVHTYLRVGGRGGNVGACLALGCPCGGWVG